jgi:hypothetical protein
MTTARRLVTLCCLVACLGCGKTKQDVIDEYRGKMTPKREQLQALAPKLAGVADKGRLNLSPVPAYDRKNDTGNTEFVGVEQLQDPDATPAYDLYLSGKLLMCLQWTGPKNPMSASALDDSAGSLPRDFEDALATRYVVVLRTLDYQKPVVLGENSYKPGSLTMEGYLADLDKKEVLTSFRVSARSDDVVDYVYKEGEDRTKAAEEWAKSTLSKNVRKEIARALTERTGGTFVLDP